MPSNVARGSILGIAGQAWHLVTAFLLYALLARALGPADFGEWRVVLSVLAWFEIFLITGVVQVTSKRLAEGSDDKARLIRASYASQMLIAAGVFVVMFLGADLIATLLDSPIADLIRIAALDVPLYALLMVAGAVLLGEERFERQAVSWMVYATGKFVCIGLGVWLGYGVAGALVGNALSSVVGFAAAFTPFPKRRTQSGGPGTWGLARSLVAASPPFLTLSLVGGLGQSVDLWVVSATIADPVLVGFYAAAIALSEVPVFLFVGFQRVIFPSVARAASEGEETLAARYTSQAIRLAVIVAVFGVAFTLGAGREVLTFVYSSEYLPAYVALAILMVAAAGRTVRGICTQILMARDRRRTALGILIGTVILEVALLSGLAPSFGLAGAATAAAVASVLGAIMCTAALRDMLTVRPLLSLVRSTLAGGLIAVALYLVPIPPWAVIPAFLVAGIAYLALLALTGEFDRDDVESVRTALSRG